ncbi:efflux RND transporter periplasmic adaptor subunit [Cellulomonas sp. H30R-01]|uniref:efflux RND transporter periplasmic adaptor subunit n=1 Tax=Cellulomonas sp. H30R-01 TaxID=2704467 RepID=UPI00138D36B8|nr:efflux RND transporter periplasmic adaptor subunit [Cellulomonas sp. H30R-01]QHT56744.1 efflux RND transporter periplasmic adaptor subunit [Cellulomonas sp. H30R-01]
MLSAWRRTRRWVRGLVVALAVAALATGTWWFTLRDPSSAAAEEPVTRTVTASLTTMEKTVDGTGTLTPAVQEDVSFAVSGTVTSVAVTQGQTVTAGQTLATVDTLRLDADLLAAKATLATAQARLDDAQDADDGTSTSDAQIASAQAQVEVARAQVDDAQAALADATLVAPVAGLLTAVDLEVGDAVTGSGDSGATSPQGGDTTSTAQFTIVGTDAWQVEVGVSDADVALVEVGDQAELTVDGADGTVFGTVASVGLLSTSEDGVPSYPVTIAVTGDQEGLHDGVSADVSVVYERRTDVLTVPSMAVSTVDGQTVVTKVEADGTQVETPVTTGETADDLTEITDGLTEGDSVVLAVFTPRATQDGGGQQSFPVPGEGDMVFQGGPGGVAPGGGTFQGGPMQGGGNG